MAIGREKKANIPLTLNSEQLWEKIKNKDGTTFHTIGREVKYKIAGVTREGLNLEVVDKAKVRWVPRHDITRATSSSANRVSTRLKTTTKEESEAETWSAVSHYLLMPCLKKYDRLRGTKAKPFSE